MGFNEIIKFANENQSCFLSTIDENKPRVRGMLMWFADESGFYFHTSSTKQLYLQLVANNNIELCFLSSGDNSKMMRVNGKISFLNDNILKEKLLKERPWLNQMSEDDIDNFLIVFKVYTGECHFWTMADNMMEGKIEKISF
ncbi:pyridoxamine 5'-phosphate oxidase domain-containing protein, FMN-binding protein [Gottschalkia acidurici 9a]|uniref:Pyridoxamine 5'-phosphate oxidase domain-containing protein, FMN-binding protein n=1 Tax=Gottschalkia acidurici (strain ATCC 7906 / DSM 604 / BCRC 14475 / CIP 104303 / KCTC 5404 / NCIMB 10678 / 9a) TaxID=1128398 RepID=K0B3X8_GOTA9|nr:pyridoxamine 5'-phosphate oxidase family protein [Gottschalkia acidurici]AFS79625.1 pyridoxamine 5'-phosphate oxidase domain-containing protein, FMN-binding protein [Gottschalkia acidurici 9a]